MPVYEYLCKACDHEFEREQRISDKPVKKCPECGAMKAKRLISRTSFVLKGGGWYNDLYASPSGDKKKQKDGDAAGAASGDSAAGKSDKSDKPEKKSESDKSGSGSKGSGGKTGGDKGTKAAA